MSTAATINAVIGAPLYEPVASKMCTPSGCDAKDAAIPDLKEDPDLWPPEKLAEAFLRELIRTRRELHDLWEDKKHQSEKIQVLAEKLHQEAHVPPTMEYAFRFGCKVCMEQPIESMLYPCQHCVACEKCIPALKSCPICRRR